MPIFSKYIPISEGKEIKVKVDYSLYGATLMLYITHVSIKKHDGYSMESFEPFNESNYKMTIKTLSRKSKKQEAIIADKMKSQWDTIQSLVLNDNRHELLELVKAL